MATVAPHSHRMIRGDPEDVVAAGGVGLLGGEGEEGSGGEEDQWPSAGEEWLL